MPPFFAAGMAGRSVFDAARRRFVNYVSKTASYAIETANMKLQKAEVTALHAADFASIESLRFAIEATDEPKLVFATASQIPTVMLQLRDRDDVCLVDAPRDLKYFRLQRLRESRGKANDRKDGLDPLTQLQNRQAFVYLAHDMAQAASARKPVSLIMCDVDHFKKLNDEYGHAAGDELLCSLSNHFQAMAGAKATVGRTGGAEFGILCHHNNRGAKKLAERLRAAVAKIKTEAGASTTISLGVATVESSVRGSELLERASKAVYAAKSSGRGCWFCFNDLENQSREDGNDIEVTGLENMARVLAERVANVITMRSRKLITDVREEADVDGLTGCFNRRYLDRRLEREFEDRQQAPLSVAFLDLDYFGKVNKEHGWSTGDKLLVEVCDLIRDHIREGDWIGRYGGEEFCIVMPNTSLKDSHRILRRIRETVEQTEFVSTNDRRVPMTLSIGGTCATVGDSNFCEMLERASEMALLAKRNGRNQVRVKSA